ncbi:LamG-like jellyroll fold domain-containing protein [Dactylosporangium sp. CA-233914]|uniref:LamG-like jellyroll fold domain-containing protein n=1 Tax=Dactylosporangium sp. CA-233914 TaxID=3239934 RepID=UPI003D9290B2
MTTPTDTVTANPSGTLTLNRTLMPVRKHVNGTWTNLDATLHRNADGTITPTVTTTNVVLAGGGTGPFVTLGSTGRSLALSPPMALPTPTLNGATATYTAVLPGVDLQVSVDAQGGFREVLVVQSATAAANPALSKLEFAAQTTGLHLVADTAGNISANDTAGRAVFTAPAPQMWDSRPAAQANSATAGSAGSEVDPATGQQVNSTASGPGMNAQVAGMAVTASDTAITITPSANLLTGPSTTYPVYLDPGWSNTKSGWASISEYYPSTKYWNTTPDPQGMMQVGNSGTMWSHSLVNFNVSALAGATIQSADLYLTEVWSYSCTPSTVNVYAPSTTLTSSNADWNDWKNVNVGGVVASANVAHGYNSSCAAAAVHFNVQSTVQTAASTSRGTQTFLFTGVNESSDHNSWKEFDPASANLSVTYDRPPATPSNLTTSPATVCAGNPPSTVGDAQVSLYAPVSDPDGGNLTATYTTSVTATGQVVDSTAVTYPSGSTAVRVLPEATLASYAKNSSGTPTVTQFSWKVQVSDGTLSSGVSGTCTFNFDPTRPGAPAVTPVTTGTPTIGQNVQYHLSPGKNQTTPTSYIYQLNGAAPQTAPADAQGEATITVSPHRYTNSLVIQAVSAGGNVSADSTNVLFNANPAAPQADQDLTGDNVPDLLTVGGTGSLSGRVSGVWLAQGQASYQRSVGNGQIVTSASNIGVAGVLASGGTPGDFDGFRTVTGHFYSSAGTSLQDVLMYKPSTTISYFFKGNGDGTPLSPTSNQMVASNFMTEYGTTDVPLQLANAGDSSAGGSFPDLIGIDGDATSGFALSYYITGGTVGSYNGQQLTTPPPSGAWNDWTITTAQVAGKTNMFLWNKSTGALYLWSDLTYNLGDLTIGYSSSYAVASAWNTNQTLGLQAADINGDGTADLRTTDPTGKVTTYLLTNLNPTAHTASINARPTQTLITEAHTWLLNDSATGNVTTAKDTSGGLNATGTSGAAWHTTDMFSPDAQFNGTAPISTPTKALDTAADFTVSAWVKPTSMNGTLLSQNGSAGPGLRLYIDPGLQQWAVSMSTNDSTSPTYDVSTTYSNPVQLNAWTHLTVTYNKASGTLATYSNGNPVGAISHTTTWTAAGKFEIGSDLTNNHFNGQIANVQVWNQTLAPPQISDLSGTPGYKMAMSDDTTYTSGTTWTAHCGAMTFSQGLLTITTTCARHTSTTYGATGYPNAVLTLQTDGNLVIYPTAAHTNKLWASATDGHGGDTLYLQEDGNLAIYGADGATLWQSNTSNYLHGSALIAHANTKYVCAESAGSSSLIANRTAVGLWESFDILDLGNGKVALLSHANNLYVTAENGGAAALIANRTTVGSWETFTLIHNSDGSVSFLANANNMYVTADNGGANPLIANRTAIGPWEEFDLMTA